MREKWRDAWTVGSDNGTARDVRYRFPNEILGILVAGIIPVRMSANQLLQLTVLWSILGTLVALTGRPQKIAHSAHLGGLLFGMTYHELWRRRLRLRGPRQLLRTRTWKS